MKKNTIITALSLALPVIGLVILLTTTQANDNPPAQENTPAKASKAPEADGRKAQLAHIQRISSRLTHLESMTKEDWDREGKELGPELAARRAPNLEEALKRNRERLAKLQKMTPEQYQEFVRRGEN